MLEEKLIAVYSIVEKMGGARAQVNKAHKTRFASKSSRNVHKVSSKGSIFFSINCVILLNLCIDCLFGYV